MLEAVIDIGTNTFNISIADKLNEKILHNEKQPVRLGKGGISKGIITDDAIIRAVDALLHYKTIIANYHVENTIVTATSAVRNATNKNEFLKEVLDKTGFEVQVLSGNEEASLIHSGVTKLIEIEILPELILDIGGGSIEFIIADKEKPLWIKSKEIGGQRLIDKFHKSDPISETEISRLNSFLEEQLNEVLEKCQHYKVEGLIGSAGSFDTLKEMFQLSNWNTKNDINSPELPIDYFNSIFLELIRSNRTERMNIPGMIAMRVDMIVVAVVVIKFLIDKLKIQKLRVSSYALKEGVLFGNKKN